MARFLSFRVAPGLRISASSRGLRAHVGPRAARLHVGGGRTGVSTGAGPLTVYESLGGSSRRSTRPTASVTPAQAQKLQQVQEASAAFERLAALHRADFTAPAREVAQPVSLPPFRKLLATAEKQELRGVGLFNRTGRKAARARARVVADGWARDLLAKAETDRRARQDVIDARWAALDHNDPAAVRAALAEAFAGWSPPVRVAGLFDGDVGLVVTLPPVDVVPPKKPATTPSGVPTLHQLTKTERNEWYAQVVASQVLLAAKNALAHAPGVEAVRAVAVDASGAPLVGARAERSLLGAADWRADAWAVLAATAPRLRFDARGRTRALVPLDLADDDVFSPVAADGQA